MTPDGDTTARLRTADGRFALCAGAALGRFGRKRGHLTPDLIAGEAQIIGRLQIEPELRGDLEPMPQPKRGIAGDRALALNDLRDAVWRDGNLARQFSRRDLELAQLVSEDFASPSVSPTVTYQT
jgi:hypothetical protein